MRIKLQNRPTKYHETRIIERFLFQPLRLKDEIRWLISLLRGFMNIPNKRIEPVADNYKINLWQYQLHPILEKYKKKWKCSNYD